MRSLQVNKLWFSSLFHRLSRGQSGQRRSGRSNSRRWGRSSQPVQQTACRYVDQKAVLSNYPALVSLELLHNGIQVLVSHKNVMGSNNYFINQLVFHLLVGFCFTKRKVTMTL